MSKKILVSDKLSEDGLEVFRKAGFQVDHLPEITQDEIKECIGQYSAWVIRSRSKATADIIQKADKLRVIGRAGVGVDNVDKEAATRKGIIVMNTPGGNTTSTAEHAISMLVSLSRKIPQADASMKAGKWDKKSFMGSELNGKTLGVLGLGRIGQEVAKRMRVFNMHLLGYDPFIPSERMRQLGIESASVDEICERADFITIHTPMTAETKGLINADRLKKMKKTARLVNCARGGIVVEADLIEALKANEIAGAALDVYESEPLVADAALRELDNIVLTPHIAASTVEAQENVAIQVAEQIVDLLRGGAARNALNVPSVDPDVLPLVAPYMAMAEKMGSFLSQYKRGRPIRMTVRYSGTVCEHPLSPITTAAIQGFLKDTAECAVNSVNASQVLKDRGVELVESKHSDTLDYTNLITIEIEQECGVVKRLGGTLFTKRHPRIVLLDDKHLTAEPTGHLLVIENDDIPGIIGSVGTVFGDNGVNIGNMTWGRKTDDDTAMTVINVDTVLPANMIAQLKKISNVKSVEQIHL
jgi:D-3-phosphoglycerate dehydrogenase / 2-oxoglutarate reductase